MGKPRKTLSLGSGLGMTPEQAALIKRQEVPRIERLEKEEQPETKKMKAEETPPPAPIPVPEVEVAPDPKPEVQEEEENTIPEKLAPTGKKKPRKKMTTKSPVSEEIPEPWITKTYRLPASLIDRLQMESLNRRIKKVSPNKQQELLAQALTEWLEKNEVFKD